MLNYVMISNKNLANFRKNKNQVYWAQRQSFLQFAAKATFMTQTFSQVREGDERGNTEMVKVDNRRKIANDTLW